MGILLEMITIKSIKSDRNALICTSGFLDLFMKERQKMSIARAISSNPRPLKAAGIKALSWYFCEFGTVGAWFFRDGSVLIYSDKCGITTT